MIEISDQFQAVTCRMRKKRLIGPLIQDRPVLRSSRAGEQHGSSCLTELSKMRTTVHIQHADLQCRGRIEMNRSNIEQVLDSYPGESGLIVTLLQKVFYGGSGSRPAAAL